KELPVVGLKGRVVLSDRHGSILPASLSPFAPGAPATGRLNARSLARSTWPRGRPRAAIRPVAHDRLGRSTPPRRRDRIGPVARGGPRGPTPGARVRRGGPGRCGAAWRAPLPSKVDQSWTYSSRPTDRQKTAEVR